MAFKLTILSDFRDLLRQTKEAGDGFEDLGDTLDDVARDSGKSADRMEDSFTDALKKVQKEGRDTGRKLGTDLRDGTRDAEGGLSELKDEANSTAREAAASFDGSAESIADAFQEVAANAFAGFGPAGAAAGLAAAAGLGLVLSHLTNTAEKATEAKEATIELAEELAEVDGNPAALDWATRLRTILSQITDDKEWFEVWQDTPKTRLEEWTEAAKRYGVTMGDVARGVAGDQDALARVLDNLDEKIRAADAAYLDAQASAAQYGGTAVDTAGDLRKFRDAVADQAQVAVDAAAMNRELTDAVAGMDDAVADAAAATESYESAVVDSLTGAGESWEQYVKNGKVQLDAYNAAMEAQVAAVEAFERNLVTASASLSQEALDYVRSMGPSAAPLLQAFVDAPLAQRERTAANWARVGAAASDGYDQGLNLDRATSSAVASAQRTANRAPVKFPTDLSVSGLDSAVRNAAQRATNNAPPVFLRTKLVQRPV